jgi:hypothetical protein
MVVNAAVFSIVSGLGADSAIVWHGAVKNLTVKRYFLLLFSALFRSFVFDLFTAFLQDDLQPSLKSTALLWFLFLRADLFSGLILIDKYTSLFMPHTEWKINKLLSG